MKANITVNNSFDAEVRGIVDLERGVIAYHFHPENGKDAIVQKLTQSQYDTLHTIFQGHLNGKSGIGTITKKPFKDIGEKGVKS